MGKGLLFFCCACCILVLTIINLSIGPVISKAVGVGDSSSNSFLDIPWATANCERFKDKKDNANCQNDVCEKNWDSLIDYCTRAKGMHDMEYTAFIFDIVIGFVCGLVGLLHLFDLKKDFVSNTGLIGLICGIIGFVLTFVYVIFNGLVFTSNYSDQYERDGDGVFAERIGATGTKYKCLNYDPEFFNSGRAKYSDLNKKQYNYKHEFYGDAEDACKDISSETLLHDCANSETIDLSDSGYSTALSGHPFSSCSKLYAQEIDDITNKDIFDRFLTALILSLVVCLANIGLALFGFLLFRTPGDF